MKERDMQIGAAKIEVFLRYLLTTYSILKALVTYFIKRSQPLPNEMFVRPPKSSKLQFLSLHIALLSSCSSSIQVVDFDFLISKTCERYFVWGSKVTHSCIWDLFSLTGLCTNEFIAATGTATSVASRFLKDEITSSAATVAWDIF